MASMNKTERLRALALLGEHLRAGKDEYLEATIKRTAMHNGWFTEANQRQAITAIAEQMLQPEKLASWLAQYVLPDTTAAQRIGLVLAGNLPLVGFHDLLCVVVAGHRSVVKLSEKDPYLLPALLRAWKQLEPRMADYFDIVPRLESFDAVIATGSNNSARYFEAYFGKYPHIIRRNRNAVAVLTGEETPEQLAALGRDVFDYYGLGCRNVAKLYLPAGYSFTPLLEALHEYREVVLNTKYKNNFDYNYALLVLNKEPFEANGCILLREAEGLSSPIANLHYEYYADLTTLGQELTKRREAIQLVVKDAATYLPFPANAEVPPVFAFGEAQQPALDDYADGVDTMAFLLGL